MIFRSVFYRFARLVFKAARPFAPTIKKYLESYRNLKIRNLYNTGAQQLAEACFVDRDIKHHPLISIVVPLYNTPHRYLLEMVYSVVNQHYANWELILINASDSPVCRKQAQECSGIDRRIRVVDVDKNKGISTNTNAGIRQAKGEFLAFADHDDTLHPCALHSVAEALQSSPRPDLVYTDEDKLSADSQIYLNPHIKPDWSVDTLRNVNFVTHLTVIRKDMVEKVGGLRSVTDGAQDYDLLLRVWDECRPQVKHIPRVLYHWRMAAGSTSDLVANKQYIIKAGTRALGDHIRRSGLEATVSHIAGKPGYYEVDYKPVDFSVVVGPVDPSRHRACADWTRKLIKPYPHSQVQLVIGEWYRPFAKAAQAEHDVKYVEEGEDYWRRAVDGASKRISVCFKAAALPRRPNGLGQLAAAATDSVHSLAVPVLVNESSIIISSGIVRSNGLTKKLFEGYKLGTYTWFLDTDWIRNTDDVTTEIIAAPTGYLKSVFGTGKDYEQASSFGQMLGVEAAKNFKPVLWAHSVFEQSGWLVPAKDAAYHSVPPFRFIPTTHIHIEDWQRDYERDES
jgi:glycosyltransferase involved in cell wall biosynthesis